MLSDTLEQIFIIIIGKDACLYQGWIALISPSVKDRENHWWRHYGNYRAICAVGDTDCPIVTMSLGHYVPKMFLMIVH